MRNQDSRDRVGAEWHMDGRPLESRFKPSNVRKPTVHHTVRVQNPTHAQHAPKVRPPQPLIDAERKEVMALILNNQFQHLRVLLRSVRGLAYMNIDERLASGEHQGLAPLHCAVIFSSSSVVSALLNIAHADPDVVAEKGSKIPLHWRGATPLHLAAEKGFLPTVKELVAAGARVDALDRRLHTPLLITVRHATHESGHERCARELVRRGADMMVHDAAGDTPFHLACDRGQEAFGLLKAMHLAASSDAVREVLSATNKSEQTPLWRACERGLAGASRLLLEFGAAPSPPAIDGTAPLHMACLTGLEAAIKVMLGLTGDRKADVNATSSSGQTPLHYALSRSSPAHARIARMLLARGARAYGRTATGESVLHACAREGNLELAELLLQQPPGRESEARAVVNGRNLAGSAPLHTAVAHHQVGVAELLMEQPALARGAHDNHGMTPLHLAIEANDVPMLRLLLTSARQHATLQELSLRNDLGWAALHSAAFRGHEMATKLLLAANAFVDERSADGWTALQLATAQGHARTAAALLEGGADPESCQPRSGAEPAVVQAAARGHSRTVHVLLERGARDVALAGVRAAWSITPPYEAGPYDGRGAIRPRPRDAM